MTEQAGVYGIFCINTGQFYVGGTNNISKRWSKHRAQLKTNQHANKRLQAAWNEFGASSFLFSVFELTNEIKEREQFWINNLSAAKTGFNDCPVAGSSLGRRWTQAERNARGRTPYDTKQMNTRNAVEKRTATRRKNRHPCDRLSWEIAQEIRKNYAPGEVTMQALADQYGVGLGTIFDIIKNKTWRTDPNEAILG